MAAEVISIGSSSSGNSYIIRTGSVNILLDVGLTAKSIIGALSIYDINPEDIDAVLVTHEHVDHIRSVRAIGRKCCNAVFAASRGTIENTANFAYIPNERLRIVEAGDSFDICKGDDTVTIRAFSLSHDAAEPLGYSVRGGGHTIAVITDTGIVTEEIYEAALEADMLVFEANHDEDLLMFGEYPYPVKVRIKSDHGHLSNKYAGEILADLLDNRKSDETLNIMLAHLSFHNNAPFYARSTIESILKECGYERDVDYTLTIAARDEITTL
ncbi:MAG: MBL fold metallo-hydrolase [Mogibacterium sp.]|nr:MBL fold metallo-hydrolase [Mogibacterium sp.]